MDHLFRIAVWLLPFSLILLFVFPSPPWVFTAAGSVVAIAIALLIGGTRQIGRWGR